MNNFNLTEINNRLIEIKKFVKQAVGVPTAPVEITADKQLNAAVENIGSLKDVIKNVKEYFKPRKTEAKKPYEELLEQEKIWIGTCEEIINFIDGQVKVYNNKKRVELEEERRKQLVSQKADEETISEVEKIDITMKTKTMTANLTEKSEVTEIQIINISEFIDFIVATKKYELIDLSSKSITAIKKWLNDNPLVETAPGLFFSREIINKYRSK